MNEKATVVPQVLLGDTNSGPANPDTVPPVNSFYESTYNSIRTAEWRNEYVDQDDKTLVLCTLCPDNFLNQANKSELIDHIFFKNAVGSNPARILTEMVTVDSIDPNTGDS